MTIFSVIRTAHGTNVCAIVQITTTVATVTHGPGLVRRRVRKLAEEQYLRYYHYMHHIVCHVDNLCSDLRCDDDSQPQVTGNTWSALADIAYHPIMNAYALTRGVRVIANHSNTHGLIQLSCAGCFLRVALVSEL